MTKFVSDPIFQTPMQPDDIKSVQQGESANRDTDARFQIGRGAALRCRGWRQEGLLRMLENTLHNGERPQDLVIYAGTGKVARNWDCFHAIVRALKTPVSYTHLTLPT